MISSICHSMATFSAPFVQTLGFGFNRFFLKEQSAVESIDRCGREKLRVSERHVMSEHGSIKGSKTIYHDRVTSVEPVVITDNTEIAGGTGLSSAAGVTGAIQVSVPLRSEEIRKNIFVHESRECPEFNDKVKEAMGRIEANPIGSRLLKKLSLYPSHINICYGKIDEESHDVEPKGIPVIDVTWSLSDSTVWDSRGEIIVMPAYVSLVHEMIHGYHELSGKWGEQHHCDPRVWTNGEEYKTIEGLPSKKGNRRFPKITENAFREAEGLPQRFGHVITEGDISTIPRLKLLGRIHERNQIKIKGSFSPPPIAMLSMSDLEPIGCWMIFLGIRHITRDYVPELNSSVYKAILDPTHQLDHSFTDDQCYVWVDPNSAAALEWVRGHIPQLRDVDFKLKAFVYMRISQDELESGLRARSAKDRS